jgi:hypothetical protein
MGRNAAKINGRYDLWGASYQDYPCWAKMGDANMWLLRHDDGKWYVTSSRDKVDASHRNMRTP